MMPSLLSYPQFFNSTLPAGADLSDKQFYWVKKSSGTYVLCNAATDIPDGVLQNKPALGEPCEVVGFGPSKVNADAAITDGAFIGTSADGQTEAKTPAGAGTNYACGRALAAAAAAGDIIPAFIDCISPELAT